MIEPSSLRLVSVLIAKKAVEYLRMRNISTRILASKEGDVTRAFDIEVEKLIIDLIKEFLPKSLIITEEEGELYLDPNPEYIIVLDPVDGSNNYASRIPWCAVNIAIAYKSAESLNDIVASTIASIFTDDVYSFSIEEGVLHNEKPIQKSEKPNEIIIVYADTLEEYAIAHRYRETFGNIKIRSLGSISMDLTLIIKNSIEAVIDLRHKLRNVDIAAAYPMIRASGGHIILLNKEIPHIKYLEKGYSIIAAPSKEYIDRVLKILY